MGNDVNPKNVKVSKPGTVSNIPKNIKPIQPVKLNESLDPLIGIEISSKQDQSKDD